jgi:RimJ/RimL family protein N-acetyltransferase
VNIRSVLLSDEHGINEHGLEQFRDQRVNIFSTWAWHEESRTATFWLRGDEMQRMKDGGWKVCMFRTDNWRSQSSFYGIDKVKDTGVRWVDQVNGKV